MEKFSFKRLLKVMKIDLCEMGRSVLALAIFTMLLVIFNDVMFYIFITEMEVLRSLTNFTINIVLFCFVVFPCSIFYNLNKPTRAVPYITLPATCLEKFVSKVFLCWFAPMLFAFVMFWFMPHSTPVDDSISSFTNIWRSYRLTINGFIIMSALMILGSAFFKKGAFGKVIGIITTLAIVLISIFAQFKSELADFAQNNTPQWINDCCQYINAEQYRISIFQLFCSFTLVAISIVIAYKRFKRFTLKS